MASSALLNIIGWVAPAATMLAAMMTAANLGARVTGWGFAVFLVGSLGWVGIALSTGQTSLMATNLFLTLVNALGVWRWLGRQSAYQDGGRSARSASRRAATPDLFVASEIAGMKVANGDGRALGQAVEALVECASGRISYVVIASGGIGGAGEELRAVPRDALTFGGPAINLRIDESQFARLPPLATGDWPAQAASPDHVG